MNKIKDFFTRQVWLIEEKSVSRIRFFFIKQLRIILIAQQGFIKNRCSEKASALTYYSLLSIVPALAMAFGIAKGFGYEVQLEKILHEKFADKKEILDQIFEFANSFLANTQGGVVAGVGVIVLFYSVMKVLNNIEISFNSIWEIKNQRNIERMLSDYFSIMLLAPILLILSNSATIYISMEIKKLAMEIDFIQHFGVLISFGLKLLPFSLVWLMFTIVYMIMPNTRVTFSAAFAGGVIAGITFQILQFIYIRFQIGVASYNAIYGSFAALPLFLVWLQMSWLIVMLGAEIAFAVQSASKYEFNSSSSEISHKLKMMIAVYLMQQIVQRFRDGQQATCTLEISQTHNIPVRIVRPLLREMKESGLISEVKIDNSDVSAYQPAFDIHNISIHRIISTLENNGTQSLPTMKEDQLADIEQKMNAFYAVSAEHEENILLLNMK